VQAVNVVFPQPCAGSDMKKFCVDVSTLDVR
jgi:hypothetical protein